jgi:hypothetical protein
MKKYKFPQLKKRAYCQARSKLPEELFQKLFDKAAQNLEEKVKTEHLWCGRNVKVIDGSSVSMPDTVKNQKAYPRAKESKDRMWVPKSQNRGDI